MSFSAMDLMVPLGTPAAGGGLGRRPLEGFIPELPLLPRFGSMPLLMLAPDARLEMGAATEEAAATHNRTQDDGQLSMSGAWDKRSVPAGKHSSAGGQKQSMRDCAHNHILNALSV